jgi:hypothetical protein
VGSRITITGAGERPALVLACSRVLFSDTSPAATSGGFLPASATERRGVPCPTTINARVTAIRKTDPPGSRQAYPWAVVQEASSAPKWIDGSSKCSFCGKAKSEWEVIAGPGVYICNECVGLCNEIIAEEQMPAR